ncbi:pilus assembly protein CpaD [Methylosinus sp. sav-2]|jgi:pilus assembly protein CpaD|uniref:CpaD family pilus assembly protein n=1 Tax=unclassified Methylosinus TaxID=2624500 RepID=UPI0004630147|nr:MULTISPECIES: CpaD family pilus assembly protein [unclassified Methylosinus]TDX63393.1 pilus assembly protein CpaD [Methylosinus sp. sav-2]
MSIRLNSAKLKAFGTRLACLAAMAPLAGCGVNRTLPAPAVAQDYRDRHPVVLADASTSIDVLPSQRLDYATTGRIHDFVLRYRRFGHGQITLLAPTGTKDQLAVRGGVDAVKRILAESGVSSAVYVASYPVTDPNLAAPVRLSFQGVRAKVAGRCGQWPADLASASSLEGWDNTTYWNFGCASQTTLAAQIDDPRDLVTPRGETPADIESRMRAIGNVRKGADPATNWNVKGTNISSVGGG